MAASKFPNWQTSIFDLKKLLGMGALLQEPKDLAMELGYQGEPEGSIERNNWLHKAVIRMLAANGEQDPAKILDLHRACGAICAGSSG